jgi:hypothetical protein
VILSRQGLSTNALRRKLWPLILGLTSSLDDFDWAPLESLFDIYNSQWTAILPDQENRFTAFRERKSIIGKWARTRTLHSRRAK